MPSPLNRLLRIAPPRPKSVSRNAVSRVSAPQRSNVRPSHGVTTRASSKAVTSWKTDLHRAAQAARDSRQAERLAVRRRKDGRVTQEREGAAPRPLSNEGSNAAIGERPMQESRNRDQEDSRDE